MHILRIDSVQEVDIVIRVELRHFALGGGFRSLESVHVEQRHGACTRSLLTKISIFL